MDIELTTFSVSQNIDPLWVYDSEMVYHEIEDWIYDSDFINYSAYALDKGFEFVYHHDCEEDFIIVQPEDCTPFI